MLGKEVICNDCPWCEQPVRIDEAQQLFYHGTYPDGWFHRHHAACVEKEKKHYQQKPGEADKSAITVDVGNK